MSCMLCIAFLAFGAGQWLAACCSDVLPLPVSRPPIHCIFQLTGASPPPLSTPRQQSKLFALLHAGLAFRYSRWQHTAALQTALVAAAMAQTAWNCPCSRIEQIVPPAGRWTVQQVATVLANVGLPAYATAATSGVIGSGGVLLSLAPGVDPCRLLLAWTQASWVWDGEFLYDRFGGVRAWGLGSWQQPGQQWMCASLADLAPCAQHDPQLAPKPSLIRTLCSCAWAGPCPSGSHC